METCLFADQYTPARDAFLDACRPHHPVRHESVPCPAAGPQGEALYTDMTWLGPLEAGKVLILQSATHGVEGYAGSAIQCHWLRNMPALPPDTAVMLIHALNPWGMAWHRRCDQDGIDLNRNFIDFTAPPPTNAGYAELRAALFSDDVTFRQQTLAEYQAQHGREALEVALSGGQFQDPQGPFFGGLEPAFANRLVHRWMDEFSLQQRRLGVIDLHTGLGPFGYGEIICDHPPGSTGVNTARRWYGDSVALPLEGTSSSVPKLGLLDYAWHAIMDRQSCFVTLEFGTYATRELFAVLLEEHRQWAQGQRSDACIEAMRMHFCPSDNSWREMVLWRGQQVIRQALNGLAAS